MKKAFLNFVKSVSLASLIIATPLFAMERTEELGNGSASAEHSRPLVNPMSPEFQSILQKFRGSIKEHKSANRYFLSQSSEEFLPLLDGLMGYVHSLPESREKQFLITFLQIHQKMGSITPGVLVGSYFKAAHLRGLPSEDEKSIFEGAVRSMDEDTQELVLGLSDPQGWEYRLISFFDNRLFAEEPAPIFLTHANYQILQVIEEALDGSFPTPYFYPVAREGKFPIEFMIECNLENVFPMAFGQKRVKAHGENFSEVGLALHDLVHGLSNTAYGALKAHIIKKTDAAVGQGLDAHEFIKSYVPGAVSKYIKLMDDLKKIYLSLKALPEGEKKPALAGFFWMQHEASPFEATRTRSVEGVSVSDDIFEVDSFSEILEMLVEESKSVINEYESWESFVDQFNTSPLTGRSFLSEDELLSSVRTHFFPEEGPDLNITIEKKRRFIKIIFSKKSGWTGSSMVTTLAHKWDNVDDSLAVLKYAGKKLTKPDLMSIEIPAEQRMVAMAFLLRVQEELCGLLDNFKEKAVLSLEQAGETSPL